MRSHRDFMTLAIEQAEKSIAEGGLPIGAVLVRGEQIISRGHNRRIQDRSVILHGEMTCLQNAGLQNFHDTTLYTTLSPCIMCAGAASLFRVALMVIGESVTFPGSKATLDANAIPYVDLEDERCVSMMKAWRSVPANEALWQSDIGY